MTGSSDQPRVWTNRIVRSGEAPASSFLANENNWRIHPRRQQAGTLGSLERLGWLQRVLVNLRTSDEWGSDRGVETIINGHLRVTLALRQGDDTPVPVDYVDLSPDEERQALLLLDSLTSAAGIDRAKLQELFNGTNFDRSMPGTSEIADFLSDYIEKQIGRYSTITDAPIYTPHGPKPKIGDLYDTTKADELTEKIRASSLPDDEKAFLIAAAQRYIVFHYRNIAEYYAQASAEVQRFFEESALVIIDLHLSKHPRLHHIINWEQTVPFILREDVRKP